MLTGPGYLDTAYPHTDERALKYLCAEESTVKEQQYAYEAFLSEWFKVAATHLRDRIPQKTFSSMVELATVWRDYLEGGGQGEILKSAVEVCISDALWTGADSSLLSH